MHSLPIEYDSLKLLQPVIFASPQRSWQEGSFLKRLLALLESYPSGEMKKMDCKGGGWKCSNCMKWSDLEKETSKVLSLVKHCLKVYFNSDNLSFRVRKVFQMANINPSVERNQCLRPSSKSHFFVQQCWNWKIYPQTKCQELSLL